VHTGKIQFSTGVDTLALTGTSKVNGDVDFGGGADVFSLGSGTSFRGTLANAGTAALTVNGTLDISTIGSVAVGSLDVGSTGVIGVGINGNTGVSTRYDVAGAASFATGSQVLVRLNNVAGSVGSFVIVDAGTLTGGNNLGTTGAILPYLFKSSLSSDA